MGLTGCGGRNSRRIRSGYGGDKKFRDIPFPGQGLTEKMMEMEDGLVKRVVSLYARQQGITEYDFKRVTVIYHHNWENGFFLKFDDQLLGFIERNFFVEGRMRVMFFPVGSEYKGSKVPVIL